MRYANWLVAMTTGASLCLLTVGGMAQLRVDTKADVPKGKALGIDGDIPRGRALGAETDVSKGKALGTDRTERRETRRIGADARLDASANLTFRSTQLIGMSIMDANEKTVGKVVDFISDPRGNILYAAVSYSGAPGFSSKLIAVPYSAFSLRAGENNQTFARLSFDAKLLEKAPSFPSNQFPNFSDTAFTGEVTEFFADILPPADRRTEIDPTLPANGPGDRPALVNPARPPRPTTPDLSSDITSTRKTGTPAPSSLSATARAAGETESSLSTSGSNSKASSRMMLRSSQMVGMTIMDKQGDALGKVVDFVGDTRGNNQFAVVSLSGEGFDDRMIVLPFHALNFQAGANGTSSATLRIAPGQLMKAPSFSGNEWPDFADERFQREFVDYYSPRLPNPDKSYGNWILDGKSGSTPAATGDLELPATPSKPSGTVAPRPGLPMPEAPKAGTPKTPRTPARPGAPGSSLFPEAPRSGPKLPGTGPGVPGAPAPGGAPAAPAPGAAPGGGAPGGAPGGTGGASGSGSSGS